MTDSFQSYFRDSLTPEERESYDRMVREEAANRVHNIAAMDEAGIPRHARRGFVRATSYHGYRIRSIEHRPSEVTGKSRWIVVVGFGESSYTTHGWIVGPRGGARQAY